MQNAQDYLAEKLQHKELELEHKELELEIAKGSFVYWNNKAFELMKKLNMKPEEIEKEIMEAGKLGFYS